MQQDGNSLGVVALCCREQLCTVHRISPNTQPVQLLPTADAKHDFSFLKFLPLY